MPSGVRPNDLWADPEAYGGIRCGVPIPNAEEITEALRAELTQTRDEVFRWVSVEFDEAAEVAYNQLGRPDMRMTNGWNIFRLMLPLLEFLDLEL
jgi:hypothetical protein